MQPYYYFLSWRPVSTPPVRTQVFGVQSLTTDDFARGLRSGIQEQDKAVFSKLEQIVFSARLDGIFIFAIQFKDSSADNEDTIGTSARIVSEYIKILLGHTHDFCQPGEDGLFFLYTQPVRLATAGDIKDQGGFLAIDVSNGAEDVIGDIIQDQNIIKLAAVKTGKFARPTQYALLKLREDFSRVRDRCIRNVASAKDDANEKLTVNEIFIWAGMIATTAFFADSANIIDLSLFVAFNFLGLSALLMYIIFSIFSKPYAFVQASLNGFLQHKFDKNGTRLAQSTLAVLLLAGVVYYIHAPLRIWFGAIFEFGLTASALVKKNWVAVASVIFLVDLLVGLTYFHRKSSHRREPIQKMIRHTIGFLSYTSVYISLTATLFGQPSTNNFSFEEPIRGLEVKLAGELEKEEKDRFYIISTLTFTGAIATTIGIVKQYWSW